MAEEQNNRWHLDKRVSVGHLITTVAMVSAAALWLLRLEGRIDLVDLRDDQISSRIEQIDSSMKMRDSEIIRRLERIQDMLLAHERNSNKGK
jgi:predicted thioredoxin/glutaredoxin